MFQNLGRWKEGFCRLGGEVMFGKDEMGGVREVRLTFCCSLS